MMINGQSYNYVTDSRNNCMVPTMAINSHNNGNAGNNNNNGGSMTNNNNNNNGNINNPGGLPNPLMHHDVSSLAIKNALQNKNYKVAIEVLYQIYRGSFTSAKKVRLDELKFFVECYCEKLGTFPPSNGSTNNTTRSQNSNIGCFASLDVLSCPVCFSLLTDPVTIQCGHSYCRKCLQDEKIGNSCKRCKNVLTNADVTKAKLNVLLGNLIDKWWAKDKQAAAFRNEGNSLFINQNGEESLEKYAQALSLIPDDYLALGNRSHVLLSLGRTEEALDDIDAAMKLCPLWTKGYFRKASVYISLGRYEEAFVNLCLCLCLVKAANLTDDSISMPVKSDMLKVLHKIFLQVTRGLGNASSVSKRRHSFDQLQYSSYPTSKKRLMHDRSRDEESEAEYNSSGDEMYSSSSTTGKSRKPKKNNNPIHHQSGYDPQIGRIHRLFDRTNAEVTRIQNDMQELRTRNNSNTNNSSNNTLSTNPNTNNSSSTTLTISRPVDPSLISLNDLECTLCYRLLHQPVTTVCGHTYCRGCLERSLDHSPACPLCKTSLEESLAHRRHAVNQILEIAITQFLPEGHAERIQQHLDEIAEVISLGRSANAEIPIFVCTMAFPTVPCPLHVFEPRYRLMIRRCVENGGKHFGMCTYQQDGENQYSDFGTLLEIKSVQYFPDGRSVVETVGRRRFKVLSKSQKDGYNIACIEMLQDRAIEPESLSHIKEIHDQVYVGATNWLKSINQVLRQRILTHFGPMPNPEDNWWDLTDGPSWVWWILAILPLDTKAQLAILSMNSLQKRLDSIHKVLQYVNTKI